MEQQEQVSKSSGKPSYINASFGRRFLASTLDGFISQVFDWIVLFVFSVISGEAFLDSLILGFQSSTYWSRMIISMVFVFTYVVGFWVLADGATPGKKIFGIKVVKTTNEKIGFCQAIVRYVSYFVSMIPLFLGYFWMLWDKEKRTWHDKIAGTKVIVVDSRSKAIQGIIVFIIFIIIIFINFGIGFAAGFKEGGYEEMFNGTVGESQEQGIPLSVSTDCWVNIDIPTTTDDDRKWDFERLSSKNITFDIVREGSTFIVSPKLTKVRFKKSDPRVLGAPGVDIRCIFNGEGWSLDEFKQTVESNSKITIVSSEESVLAGKMAYKMELGNSEYKENYIFLSPDESRLIHVGVISPEENDPLKDKILKDIEDIKSSIKGLK
jgi:uncharacterized RDD family membrane protein YckC